MTSAVLVTATAALVALTMLLTTAGHASAAGALSGAIPQPGRFGLVVWSGGPVAEIDTAARAQQCVPLAFWVSRDGEFIGYVFGAPMVVNEGFARLFAGSVPAQPLILSCASVTQPAASTPTAVPPASTPGTVAATVVFRSTMSEDSKRTTLNLISRAESHYGAETAVRLDGLTIYIATVYDDLAAVYERGRTPAVARDDWFKAHPSGNGGTANSSTVFMVNPTWTETTQSLVSHELFHAVQLRLSGGFPTALPLWAIEGGADYAAGRHVDSIAGTARPYLPRLHTAIRLVPTTLADLTGRDAYCQGAPGERLPCFNDAYTLGHGGWAWLAERSAAGAFVEFWRSLRTNRDWPSAFAGAFGMSVSQFYDGYEAYRLGITDVAVTRIQFTVDGSAPDSNWVVGAQCPPSNSGCAAADARSRVLGGGSYLLAARPGSYLLYAQTTSPATCGFRYLSATPATPSSQPQPSTIAESGSLAFNVSALPACATASLSLSIGGVPAVAPVRVGICALDSVECYSGAVDATGTVQLRVPGGSYGIYLVSGTGCTSVWAAGGTISRTRAAADRVEVPSGGRAARAVSVATTPPCTFT